MAKKLWVGLGIGCGGLILIAVVAVVAAGYWAKKSFGGFAESAHKAQAQHVELAKLDKDYPFEPAGDVTLTESRLKDYLAVRSDALTAYEALQGEIDALKSKDKEKEKMSMSQGMAAAQQVMLSAVEVEQHYIDGLKSHKMSPTEFQAISRVALSDEAPSGPNAALLTQHKAEIEQVKNPGLDGLLVSGDPGATVKRELAH